MMSPDKSSIILPHGGYQQLKSFQMSEIVYDATMRFCARFVDKYSRTTDQMIQAARSGRQNIAEGSMASGISKETEIKLVGVARASLEELLLDYQDYLRQHGLKLWTKDDPKAIEVRSMGNLPDRSYKSYMTYIESPAETAANAIICLTHQTNYLLDRQLRQLEEQFVKQGGLRERMYKARQNEKKKRTKSHGTGYF